MNVLVIALALALAFSAYAIVLNILEAGRWRELSERLRQEVREQNRGPIQLGEER